MWWFVIGAVVVIAGLALYLQRRGSTGLDGYEPDIGDQTTIHWGSGGGGLGGGGGGGGGG